MTEVKKTRHFFKLADQYRSRPKKLDVLYKPQFARTREGRAVIQYLLEEQGERCGVCQIEFGDSRDYKVDHCHETGKVRGLLCLKCNLGLGMFRDSSQLLQRAARYLTKARKAPSPEGLFVPLEREVAQKSSAWSRRFKGQSRLTGV